MRSFSEWQNIRQHKSLFCFTRNTCAAKLGCAQQVGLRTEKRACYVKKEHATSFKAFCTMCFFLPLELHDIASNCLKPFSDGNFDHVTR